jgi:hypothetical protein
MASQWEKLRKEAKSLETFIDSQLSSYASSYHNQNKEMTNSGVIRNSFHDDESAKFEKEIDLSLSNVSNRTRHYVAF